MMKRMIGWMVLMLLAAGCGVPNGKTLSELDSDDREAICEDVKKEDALCDVLGNVTRSRTGCEQLLASVNSQCDVSVKEYRESLEKSVCSMLEDWEDWEYCFGEPEEEEVIVITTNSETNSTTNSSPQNSSTADSNGVELVATDGQVLGDFGYFVHSFSGQIGTQQPITQITKVSFVMDPDVSFGTLSTTDVCLPDALVDSGLSGKFGVRLDVEDGANTRLDFDWCDAELGAIEYRAYTDIEWIVEGELEDGTSFRASTDVSLTLQ